MNIKQKFIELTSQTYPYGTEQELFSKLPKTLKQDEFGNLFIQIGERPSCMFTSHLDTASSDKSLVNHIIEGNIIKTDGNSILGADDKAGVTIMLLMIENNVPGLYYFFLGEERGCIGSKKVADKHRKEPLEGIKKVISFDRRGYDSIITFQSSSRCCSEKFASQLAEELNRGSIKEQTVNLEFNYRLDPTGIYTDSYQFTGIYSECTNISVGYMNEHTKRESQDILHLEKLAKVCLIVDWEGLISERDQNKKENNTNYYDYDKDVWEYSYQKYKKPTTKRHWFVDTEYDKFISLVETDDQQNIIKYDVSPKRKSTERDEICKFLQTLDLGITNVEWDGLTLLCEHTKEFGGHISEISRKEIEPYVEHLRKWKGLVTNKD